MIDRLQGVHFSEGDRVRWSLGGDAWAEADVEDATLGFRCDLRIRVVSARWADAWHGLRPPAVGDLIEVNADHLKRIAADRGATVTFDESGNVLETSGLAAEERVEISPDGVLTLTRSSAPAPLDAVIACGGSSQSTLVDIKPPEPFTVFGKVARCPGCGAQPLSAQEFQNGGLCHACADPSLVQDVLASIDRVLAEEPESGATRLVEVPPQRQCNHQTYTLGCKPCVDWACAGGVAFAKEMATRALAGESVADAALVDAVAAEGPMRRRWYDGMRLAPEGFTAGGSFEVPSAALQSGDYVRIDWTIPEGWCNRPVWVEGEVKRVYRPKLDLVAEISIDRSNWMQPGSVETIGIERGARRIPRPVTEPDRRDIRERLGLPPADPGLSLVKSPDEMSGPELLEHFFGIKPRTEVTPPRPDGFSQSQVDAAKAVLLAKVPKGGKK